MSEGKKGETPQVLAAEDQPTEGTLYRLVLNSEGVETLLIETGDRAMRVLNTPYPLCVAIVDDQMPPQEGQMEEPFAKKVIEGLLQNGIEADRIYCASGDDDTRKAMEVQFGVRQAEKFRVAQAVLKRVKTCCAQNAGTDGCRQI